MEFDTDDVRSWEPGGSTVEEAIANLKEATEFYLEEFPLPAVGKALLTTFEAAVSEPAYV